jgi:hypothetical protein
MGLLFKRDLSDSLLEELFSNDERCLEFLASVKWESGYTCRKCGNDNYCDGKTPYSRRCTRCKTDESATAGTIFHNCKFPLHKAFYIAWHVCRGPGEISTYEYARRLSLRQMTCWNFRTRIQKALKEMKGLSDNERRSVERILSQSV